MSVIAENSYGKMIKDSKGYGFIDNKGKVYRGHKKGIQTLYYGLDIELNDKQLKLAHEHYQSIRKSGFPKRIAQKEAEIKALLYKPVKKASTVDEINFSKTYSKKNINSSTKPKPSNPVSKTYQQNQRQCKNFKTYTIKDKIKYYQSKLDSSKSTSGQKKYAYKRLTELKGYANA